MTSPPFIREARDEDGLDVIELIGGVFAEYPSCILDVDGELPELRRVASWARELGGEFWVAERTRGGSAGAQGTFPWIVGCGGYTASGDTVELRKLYVHRLERTSGLGSIFATRVELAAKRLGKPVVELWSDTKFTTAHAFYERRGYVRGGTRDLGDKSATVEFHFRKELAP